MRYSTRSVEMGNQLKCCLSKTNRRKELKTFLTAKQIKIIKETWPTLKHDIPRLGIIVFLRFFETEPEMKTFFPYLVLLNETNELECEIDREALQKHAVTVIEALGAAVESLEGSQTFNKVLVSIGQTHVHRNVKPHMLKKMWPCLNYGLGRILQNVYTKPAADAWKAIFDYMCLYIKVGMDNPDKDSDISVDDSS